MVKWSPRSHSVILAEAICATIRPRLYWLISLFAYDHSTKMCRPISYTFFCLYDHSTKIKVLNDLFLLFVHDHLTSQVMVLFHLFFPLCRTILPKLGSSLIYFICTRPFDQKLGSSLIYFICIRRLFDQKLVSSLIFFVCPRLFDRKVGSLLIYFYLYMTIRPKIRVLINFLLLLFIHNHSTKVRSHTLTLSLIYSFLHCADISFPIFKAVLPSYFVCSVSGRGAFIFRPLYS